MKKLLYVIVLVAFAACNREAMKTTNLTCEYLTDPLAINTSTPHLGWQITATQDAAAQSAYRIIVASSVERLAANDGDLWDTNTVASNQTQQITYQGTALSSSQQAFWKVMAWDKSGEATPWSTTGSFTVGKLNPSDWSAKWIGTGEDADTLSTQTSPAPYLRRGFTTDKRIKRAIAHICGIGFYELYINGHKVGDQVLAPAVTNYDKRSLNKLIYHYDDQSTQRTLYNVFDVTTNIEHGDNAVGVVLGNGWYNQRDRTVEGNLWYNTPRMILQLEIEFTDGSRQVILSDDSWSISQGGLQSDGLFSGERYDARLEPTGWAASTYDDSAWRKATIVSPPSGKLEAQTAPFDRIKNHFKPQFVEQINDTTYRYSLPEVISGWLHLTVNGKAGDAIQLRFIGEEGEDFGQRDTYILSGAANEQWRPRFTWHTFRYFEMSSRTITPETVSFVAESVHTDVPQTGSFASSDKLLNALFDCYIRTQNANFHGSISSDCPHRERLAYTGDGQVTVETCLYTYDMRQFYRKWFNDIDDARNHRTGYVPHTAPFGGGGGGPAWGSAYVIMPWAYYRVYQDPTILESHYEGMKQWVKYLTTRTDERGIVVREEPNGWCLGDWCAPGGMAIPEPLVNTAYYYYSVATMAKVADVLQKRDDTIHFQTLTTKIKRDFNAVFYDSQRGCYWEARQGADVFPLAFGIVEEENHAKVLQSLVDHIKQLDYHFDTGILATPLQLSVLSDNGYTDVAYKLMTQTTYPAFGEYLLDPACTGMWEDWEGRSSRCHPMFGSVVAWLYRHLAGITIDAPERGIVIKPTFIPQLDHVQAHCVTPAGRVAVSWYRAADGKATLDVEIPANAQATILLPTEGQWKNTSHRDLTVEQGATLVGSGRYQFSEL